MRQSHYFDQVLQRHPVLPKKRVIVKLRNSKMGRWQICGRNVCSSAIFLRIKLLNERIKADEKKEKLKNETRWTIYIIFKLRTEAYTSTLCLLTDSLTCPRNAAKLGKGGKNHTLAKLLQGRSISEIVLWYFGKGFLLLLIYTIIYIYIYYFN